MGSGFSFLSTPMDNSSTRRRRTPELGDLPEDCVAEVLSHLDPPEICRLAKLNLAFRGASSADFVWESKLPANYESIIHRVFESFPMSLCKKDIYGKLCRPIDIDGGTKRFWLDKVRGKACLSISSQGLSITGVDDRRYWNRISTNESRFGTIAYLQQTWWLEIEGEVEFPFPVGTYSVFVRLQLGQTTSNRFGRQTCNTQHVHGWDKKPVQFKITTSSDQPLVSQRFLGETGKWVLHHCGDFVVEDCSKPVRVKFSMTQIDCTHTKGGLCVDSVLIYPSQFRREG
ncbi:F-box protein PP2-A13-like [Impatiens glandulifera]|uniref:F-box protein PP2-A13-like n=1 Tax=Impatiens glandulifera TaxID=253017 RepID=UPI001FB09514|nr:F-box protein PP2-A13-like [Impatiens glandulifera]